MIPLQEIGFNWRSHKAALSWLWLLYRRPADFQLAVGSLSRGAALRAGVVVYLYGCPYAFLVVTLLRICLEVALGHSFRGGSLAFWIEFWIELALASGLLALAFGLAFGSTGGITFGLAFGIAFALVGIAGSIAFGTAFGIVFVTVFGFAFGAGFRIAVGLVLGAALGSIVFVMSSGQPQLGLEFGIEFGIAFGIAALRAYYIPFVIPFVWPRVRPHLYRFHPVAWDNMCLIPYPGLDRLLAAYAEQNTEAGEAEIERIIDECPAQADAATRAKTILLARHADRATSLRQLPQITAKLPTGDKGYLSQCRQIHETTLEIAGLQTRLDTIDRPLFRKPTAELLLKEIQSFGHRAAGFEEPLRTEFRKAAVQWERIARAQLEQIQAVGQQESVQQFFRAGDPVDRNREAFIPRSRVTEELEQQVMLSTGCPGVILYGEAASWQVHRLAES